MLTQKRKKLHPLLSNYIALLIGIHFLECTSRLPEWMSNETLRKESDVELMQYAKARARGGRTVVCVCVCLKHKIYNLFRFPWEQKTMLILWLLFGIQLLGLRLGRAILVLQGCVPLKTNWIEAKWGSRLIGGHLPLTVHLLLPLLGLEKRRETEWEGNKYKEKSCIVSSPPLFSPAIPFPSSDPEGARSRGWHIPKKGR